ncbi:monovalent cation:proton antiporter-2 (CPA2) family protein [Algimonas porphyrae]|uniref:Potassium transporter n=1 Tax=Algimonas porphyrae TaxID=1128113 RepID=A0ABQ5V334_9PROT|nr:monovalent cation:proton antiporter-2 (CPA2) family protein [Algimonas porphyrae]GLQ21945.1 potassium transporter [Algimonas porphyrae]
MDGSFLLSAFIFLCAASLLVPISKLSGLGSVIGYLVAGLLIGPSVLGLISDPITILHFAEFGVVMMLFLIGLELEPRKLWSMRGKLIGVGGSQVLLTLLAIAGIALIVGLSTGEALAVGMALSLSSTAMALQILQQRRLMAEPEGQSGFSVLLFQDVIVIAMIAAMPILATLTPFDGVTSDYADGHAEPHGPTGVWLGVAVIGVFVGMFLGGRYLLAPLFRLIARSEVRETFTAVALLLVVGAALLMNWLGLSAALGAFIAGMVLADSEYRHQLERDIEPFKALLLGLFFISVGMSLDLAFIASEPILVISLVAGLMGLKFFILLLIGRMSGLKGRACLFFSALLCQAGEFGFVIFTFATTEGAIRPETAAILTAVIALSMAMTPLILLIFDKLILPRFDTDGSTLTGEAPYDQHHPVLILGYGRIGQIIGRLLEAQGIRTTLIDNNGDHIEFLKQFHHRVFYGDATDMDLLRQAGAGGACIIVVAIADNLELVRRIKKSFPDAKLIVRAKGRVQLFDLLAENVHFAERETVRGALALGEAVLTDMGYNEEEADMLVQRFLELDYENIQQTYHLRGDIKALAEMSSEARLLLKETLETELEQRRADRN